MSLVTSCPTCGTVFKMAREQLDASEGWVRCGHCMEVFDAKAQLYQEEEAVSEQAADFNPDALSFVQEAKQKAFWSSPTARVILILLSVLLGAVLALQMLRQETFPEGSTLGKIHVSVCSYWPCLPLQRRQLDAWVIESSTFQKESIQGAVGFRLGVVLKNTTNKVLATPAIELSLTDANDAVLSRRVLQQADFGEAAPADWQILIKPDLSLGTVAGYRVILFYP